MPTLPITRRAFTRAGLAATVLPLLGHSAVALDRDAISIAYPNDVPTWDPHLRLAQNAQSLYKMVFDSPLTQAPDLSVVPNLVRAWHYRDPLTLELELRDDALFHNGDKVTARDLRYTFFERPRASLTGGGPRLDTAFIWRRLDDIEIVSPQRAVMRFREPMPSAVTWLYFLASLIVPKDHVETVGAAEFARNPVGSGPYRLVEYEMNVRSVFEAFDRYWGGAPPIKRVTVDVVQDVFARVASLDSRRADLAVDLPIREITRLGATPGLVGRIDPVTDIVILELTRTGLFERQELRLAAHHAIDKQAISRALFAGKALPIDVAAAHGTPGYPEDFRFPYDPAKAAALVRQAGLRPRQSGPHRLLRNQGRVPQRFRGRPGDRRDVAQGRHRGESRAGCACQVFRAAARHQAPRGDALLVGQHNG